MNTDIYSGTSLSSEDLLDANYRPMRGDIPEWLEQTVVRAFTISRDDQDPAVLSAVHALLLELANASWAGAPTPFLSATEEGGLSAEFEVPGLFVHLTAQPDGELWAYVLRSTGWEWEGPVDDAMPYPLAKFAFEMGLSNPRAA